MYVETDLYIYLINYTISVNNESFCFKNLQLSQIKIKTKLFIQLDKLHNHFLPKFILCTLHCKISSHCNITTLKLCLTTKFRLQYDFFFH